MVEHLDRKDAPPPEVHVRKVSVADGGNSWATPGIAAYIVGARSDGDLVELDYLHISERVEARGLGLAPTSTEWPARTLGTAAGSS